MSSLGLSLRVTGYQSQGGRRYMEDTFCIAAQEADDCKDVHYAYFAIYDGHGGKEASEFARNHLINNISNLKNFWSDDDDLVLKAIRDGFINTHLAMWKEVDKWKKTVAGLPSTAGTTASVAILRKGKLYIGHVGDSRIVLGYEDPDCEFWKGRSLTTDHKPGNPQEKKRIYECGGQVVNKSGVDRVVWKRPRSNNKGTVRRNSDFDKIPFLAIARSLGDLWSYNPTRGEFVVSPEPDVCVVPLNPDKDRCIIIASDGLWSVMQSDEAVKILHNTERDNQSIAAKLGIIESQNRYLSIPSKVLVQMALERWNNQKMLADNTSVITIMIDHLDSPKTALQKNEDFVKVLLETEQSKKSSEENMDPLDGIRYENDGDRPFLIGRKSIGNFGGTFGGANNNEYLSRSLTSSPLQSLNISHDHCNLPEYKTNGFVENLSPFPRWSKSATGQTSLSKLASWSHLVNKRRFSEPTENNCFDNNISSHSTSTDVPTEIKFPPHYKVSENVPYFLNYNDTDSDNDDVEEDSNYSSNAFNGRNPHPFLREPIKRKFAETQVCSNAFGGSSHVNCECAPSWRKKAFNRPSFPLFKNIYGYMSQND